MGIATQTENGRSIGGIARSRCDAPRAGLLIVNADDWGRDPHTTGRILDCALRGAISSVSAMVFMEDSERSAAIARERGMDAGLHLNLTTPFSARSCPPRLREYQQELSNYLRLHFLARAVYHPWLGRSFDYVVKAQIDEYCRLYGTKPERFDGHHHMHLCANVLFGNLLPPGTIVRRHFSWESREKRLRNGLFRKLTDLFLARRFRLVEYLFSLPSFEPPARLQRIFSLACQFIVEVETHPVNPEEYNFLAGGEIFRWAGQCPIASRFAVE